MSKSKKKNSGGNSAAAFGAENYKNKIITFLQTGGKKLMPIEQLEKNAAPKNSAEKPLYRRFPNSATRAG